MTHMPNAITHTQGYTVPHGVVRHTFIIFGLLTTPNRCPLTQNPGDATDGNFLTPGCSLSRPARTFGSQQDGRTNDLLAKPCFHGRLPIDLPSSSVKTQNVTLSQACINQFEPLGKPGDVNGPKFPASLNRQILRPTG